MSHSRFARRQSGVILAGVLVIVLTIVVLQLWLLTVTMEAWLGGDDAVILPAALASTAGLLANIGLVRYLKRLES